jgi:hypothetical protein
MEYGGLPPLCQGGFRPKREQALALHNLRSEPPQAIPASQSNLAAFCVAQALVARLRFRDGSTRTRHKGPGYINSLAVPGHSCPVTEASGQRKREQAPVLQNVPALATAHRECGGLPPLSRQRPPWIHG